MDVVCSSGLHKVSTELISWMACDHLGKGIPFVPLGIFISELKFSKNFSVTLRLLMCWLLILNTVLNYIGVYCNVPFPQNFDSKQKMK